MATQFHQGASVPQSGLRDKVFCYTLSLAVVYGFLTRVAEYARRDRGAELFLGPSSLLWTGLRSLQLHLSAVTGWLP